MISNEPGKFIFIHIPKTAGITLRNFFSNIGVRKELQLGHPFYDVYNSVVDVNTYHIVTCIRNPYDRLVSAFHHVKRGGITNSDKLLREELEISELSFSEFVKTKLDYAYEFDGCHIPRPDNVGDQTPRHFLPAYRFLEKFNVDTYIRFENLQKDIDIFCEKLDFPKQQLPHFNKSKHKHYTEYYDDETRSIVAEKYAKDIELFGYKFVE